MTFIYLGTSSSVLSPIKENTSNPSAMYENKGFLDVTNKSAYETSFIDSRKLLHCIQLTK